MSDLIKRPFLTNIQRIIWMIFLFFPSFLYYNPYYEPSFHSIMYRVSQTWFVCIRTTITTTTTKNIQQGSRLLWLTCAVSEDEIYVSVIFWFDLVITHQEMFLGTPWYVFQIVIHAPYKLLLHFIRLRGVSFKRYK